MKFIIYLSALSLFCFTGVAHAQCGRVCNRVVQQQVVQQAVVTDVVTPVAFPVFIPSFQFAYQPAVCQPVAPTQLGPVMQPVAGKQQLQPTYGLNTEQNRVKALAKALLEEMGKQQDGGGTEDKGPPVAIMEGISSAPSPVSPISILANNCAVCHTGANAKKGFNIFNSPGQFNMLVNRSLIAEAITPDDNGAVFMPPANHTQLRPDERQTLINWATGGQ